MSRVPELRTERLLMRAWRDEDLDEWTAIAGHPDVYTALGRTEPVDPADAWREMAFWAGHWALKGFGHWVLEEQASGTIVGRAGLLYPPNWPGLEVGWTVAPEHWGKGYAPEAGRAACEWAHDVLGARHIISLIEESNERSIRVAEKLGERHEGKTRLQTAAGEFELLVYGADLPLAASA
ncbi:MAG: GNAT family N-acetyltransferase [Thermoleophilaceae bacterium]